MAAKKNKVQPGVIGKPSKYLIRTKEVMEIMGVGETKARNMINSTRKELIKQGLGADLPPGSAPRKRFFKRYMLEE